MTSTHALFQNRPEPHTIILARGDRVRHWQVRPAALTVGLMAVSALALSCLGAATLFFLSDDVAVAFKARESRTVAAYEERIASLREQVDSLTTRQVLDRDTIRQEVSRLLDEQKVLNARVYELEPLLDEARSNGIIDAIVPVPQARPAHAANINAYAPGQASTADTRFEQFGVGSGNSDILSSAEPTEAFAFAALSDEILPSIERSLEEATLRQATGIRDLTDLAVSRTTQIQTVLDRVGVSVPVDAPSGIGGPFVPYDEDAARGDVERLADALTTLTELRTAVQTLPIHHPAIGAAQSSTFGVRQDPFLKRKALHGGLDFAAPTGTPVAATAAGTVVSAGTNGGYGKMVEVEHAGGFVTRYAHLSRISVQEGETIEAGTIVGAIGSTGRSTGPHLHYEVRRNGSAINPKRFIEAGAELASLL